MRRARKYEFPNPLAVEIFLWDCELAAQLQDACSDVVLKGGAAAQLHLLLEKQRGSIDIDVVAPLKRSDVDELVQKVSKSSEGSIEFKLHQPKTPVPRLPVATYFAKMPAKLDLARKELEIKIDITLESPDLPSSVLKNIETFAVDVKKMKCLTAGALIGDKLLTLAKGSIGMELEADYPKQIYDIDALLETCQVSKKFMKEMSNSVETLAQLEASYRNMNITTSRALGDVTETMDEYSLVDTSGASSSIKKNIEGFQQFFVNKNQRRPFFGWSSKALKTRFLAVLIRERIENRLDESDIAKAIADTGNISRKLDKISGPDVIGLRKELLRLAETKIKYFREMKGKPLDRVFWQIVTPKNLRDVKSLIQNF